MRFSKEACIKDQTQEKIAGKELATYLDLVTSNHCQKHLACQKCPKAFSEPAFRSAHPSEALREHFSSLLLLDIGPYVLQ